MIPSACFFQLRPLPTFMIFKHYVYILNVYINIYAHILITRRVHSSLICVHTCLLTTWNWTRVFLILKRSLYSSELTWEGACRCLETTSLHLAEARNLHS